MKKKTQIAFLSTILLIGVVSNLSAQDWNTAGNAIIGTDFFGSTTNFPLNFRTNNTPYMTLRTDGNLNLVDAATGFWINGNPILWHNNDISNIYVGVGAGIVDGGTLNVFVGGTAGSANTSGFQNTFVGSLAGHSNTSGYFNTFIGENAGGSNTTGTNNAFVVVGGGFTNTTGIQNVSLGSTAGYGNTTGSNNVFIGQSAQPSVGNLSNAIAIGAFSYVTQSNSMVLGCINGVNDATVSTNVGIGTTAPQNRLHLSSINHDEVFAQITNQSGTGQTANDGLQIGLPATSATNLEARINQRENDRLTLFSNNGERIRVTQLGALNNGVAFNPGGLDDNLTRIGISHDPASPVTRPLSLIHLGYNVANATSNDGWRSWMDVGMFISQSSDNMYLGMQLTDAGSDAVLGWGDNTLADGSGPDNFKVVFTATQNPGLGLPAESQEGLEGLRMTPRVIVNGLNIHEEIQTGIGGRPNSQ